MSTTLTVEADGGSRGNPGPAGYGALVREGSLVLAERGEAIGVATNNVAEYRGLIAGLEAAREIDPSAQLEVRMDSKLVVEQMSGRWKIKHADMQKLAAQAATLVATFPRVNFTWIPRAQNSAADALANAAMDAAAAGQDGSSRRRRVARAADPHRSRRPGCVRWRRPTPLGSGWGRPSGAPTSTFCCATGRRCCRSRSRFSGLGSDPELTAEGRRAGPGGGRAAHRSRVRCDHHQPAAAGPADRGGGLGHRRRRGAIRRSRRGCARPISASGKA